MTQRCPECGHRLNPVLFVGFLRLGAVPCPLCKTLLAIDGRSRSLLWAAVIVTALLAGMTVELAGSELAGAVALILGLAASAFILTRLAAVSVSPEDPAHRSEEPGRQSRD
jgi:hypothetical protein